MSKQVFNKNDVIFKQGDFANCMYDILSGKVAVYANYGEENEKQLTVLDADAFFGEMGMLEGYPRSATAIAVEDNTELEMIVGSEFAEYFGQNPKRVMEVMQHMSRRIRTLTGDYMDACRAIVEYAEAENSGKEKSSWLKEHVKKFIADFNSSYGEAMKSLSTSDFYWR